MYVRQLVAQVATPVLRITHRQRCQAALTTAAQFDWYLCPQEGAFRHLVLVANQQVHAHWVLPALRDSPAKPTTGLWMQVTPELGLALPVAAEASYQGAGWAVVRTDGAATTAPAIQELLLHLPAASGPSEVYWLRQLQPGSSSWLLSKRLPHRHVY